MNELFLIAIIWWLLGVIGGICSVKIVRKEIKIRVIPCIIVAFGTFGLFSCFLALALSVVEIPPQVVDKGYEVLEEF